MRLADGGGTRDGDEGTQVHVVSVHGTQKPLPSVRVNERVHEDTFLSRREVVT